MVGKRSQISQLVGRRPLTLFCLPSPVFHNVHNWNTGWSPLAVLLSILERMCWHVVLHELLSPKTVGLAQLPTGNGKQKGSWICRLRSSQKSEGFPTIHFLYRSRKCHFLPEGGLSKIGGIRYFFLDQKGDQKIFLNYKGGSPIFFRRNKIFC